MNANKKSTKTKKKNSKTRKNSTAATNGVSSTPRANPPKQRRSRLLPCWARSVLDPFSAGPCRIPDPDTRACFTATSRVSTAITTAANAGNTIAAAGLFSPILAPVRGYVPLTATGTSWAAGVQAAWFNASALCPNSGFNRGKQFRMRATAMAVTMKVNAGANDAGTMFWGQVPVRSTTSVSSLDGALYDVGNITVLDPGFYTRYQEVPFTGQAGPQRIATAWIPINTPQFTAPTVAGGNTADTNTNLYADGYREDALIIGFSAGAAGVTGDIDAIVHWEVIPSDDYGSAGNPTPSFCDLNAFQASLNAFANIREGLNPRKVLVYEQPQNHESAWETPEATGGFGAMLATAASSLLASGAVALGLTSGVSRALLTHPSSVRTEL